jgi:hypothetical protein
MDGSDDTLETRSPSDEEVMAVEGLLTIFFDSCDAKELQRRA